jgi:Tfp pilus assembly protein PilX
MTKHSGSNAQRFTERGISTLFTVLSLLGMLTVITLFALSYGVHEQRVSRNEYRYKLAFQAAEAGLNQAAEYAKLSRSRMTSSGVGGWLNPSSLRWQPCTATIDTSTWELDPCQSVEPVQRAQMYRYVGTTNGVLPLSSALPSGLSQTFNNVGSDGVFAATYQVYATLCRIDDAVPGQCSLNPTSGTSFAITLASRSRLGSESAVATVKRTYQSFRTIGADPAAPLIAAGVVTGLGSAEIVPNPNGGGPGVALSVWTNGNAEVSTGGTFKSCHLGEWLDNPQGAVPSAEDKKNGICETCSCVNLSRGYGLLTNGGATRVEGGDILDDETAGGTRVVNADGNTDQNRYFPPDLFAYIFNVQSADAEAYLRDQAQQITDCSTLNSASAGLIWYTPTSDCRIPSNTQVGTLEDPVVLVSNAKVDAPANTSIIFGLVYVRCATTCSNLLQANGATIYGAAVLEAGAGMAGSPRLVYNRAVFNNIASSPAFARLGAVAGSWSDGLR